MPGSDTEIGGVHIRDPQFLDRLDYLAKEAERVRRLANHVATATLDEAAHPNEYLRDLSDRSLLEMVCGRRRSGGGYERELKLFWNSQRVLIAAQFSGFHLDGVRAAVRAVLSTLEHPGENPFWHFRPRRSSFARAFALLSLLSVVWPRAEKELSKEAQERVGSVRSRLIADLMSGIQSVHGASPLRLVPVLKLIRRVDPKAFGQLEPEIRQQEKLLAKDLAHLLLNEDAPAVEIARMLRVLGGRYLNPGSQIDPAQSQLFQHAVTHILKSRSGDGSWQVDGGKTREPIAFVLDLPNSVLVHSIAALADTVTDALGALKRRLGTYEFTLPADRVYRKGESSHADVNTAIYDGLMVSAAVSDRLRDLLSDAELDELGAAVPANFVPWKSLPNSLDFVESVTEGVISLWRERSEKRPGAILIFGPPGTGKTTIAQSLLAQLNLEMRTGPGEGTHEDWRFLALSPADFARDGSDKIIASAERLFRRLQRVRRCVVLLDEMEEFLRVRGPGSSQESRLITTAFLPLLQETVKSREIILIVATNFVGSIDPTVTRRGRFDLILPLGPPDARSRSEIIADEFRLAKPSVATNKAPLTVDLRKKEHRDEIVKYTMGYTRAEILDYLNELRTAVAKFPRRNQLRSALRKRAAPAKLTSAAARKLIEQSLTTELKIELWRIRQERVPMALSGIAGCNWRTFRDEAARFKRGPIAEDTRSRDDSYWKDPQMPEL